MTLFQRVLTIIFCVLATVCTRFLPFLLFSDKRSDGKGQLPPYVLFLGKALPAAIFGMLVVYCLKNVSVFSGNRGIPELISIVLIVLLHLWKRKTLLSIAAGTVCYMLLIQYIFV